MELKGKIEDVAFALFLKYGLRSVSIDDICNEMHISKKTFYSHFKTKNELIEAVLVIVRNKSEANKKTISEGDIIDSIVRKSNIFRNEDSSKYENFFFDLQKYYPEIASNHEREMRIVSINQVHASLLKGIEQGCFKKDLNVEGMSIMISANIPETFQLLREYANMTRAQAMDFIIDSFIGLVANEKGLAHYNELKEKNITHNDK